MVLIAGKMYRPTDVVVDIASNSVFVVEQFNHRISKWDYTPGSYNFTLDVEWGSNEDGTSGEGAPIGDGGPTDNALNRPTGIAFDSTNGLLYVTDTFHNRVRVLTASTGEFTTSLGQGGFGDTDFYQPAGIAINELDAVVIIADELNQRVVRYTTNPLTFSSVLFDPSGVITIDVIVPGTGYTVDPEVTITGGNGIGATATATTDGNTITSVDITSSGKRFASLPTVTIAPPDAPGTTATATATIGGQLSLVRPHGVVFDAILETRFNVTDSQRGRITRYNIAGLFVDQYGTPGTTIGSDNLFFPGSGTGVLTGTSATVFADTRNNDLKALNGITIALITGTIAGTGDGDLYFPESVAGFLDTVNYVLAANTLNNRVEAYSNVSAALDFESNFGTP